MKYREAKEEIKNRVSIVDTIRQYVPLKQSGSNWLGLCPFHADKNPSMSVNEGRKMFKCFACNEGGDVFHFLSKMLNISYYEAVKQLAATVNIDIENDFNENKEYKLIEEKKKKLFALHKDVANMYYKYLHSDVGREAYNYLKVKRKLKDETILKFGLGYAPKDSLSLYNYLKEKGYEDDLIFESTLFRLNDNNRPVGYFFDRVIFPVLDIHKNILGFQSRTLNLEEKDRKYLNSKTSLTFHKDNVLFGFNNAFFSKLDYYIICEGNMDVISLYQSGFDNAVAAQGTSFNEKLVFILKKKPKKIYLCGDMDDAGIKAKNKVAEILNKYKFENYVIDLSPVKDVDEFINDASLGVEELKKRLANPIPSTLYYISTAKLGLNPDDPYDYEKYLNKVVAKLASIENPIVRDSYIKKAAKQENIDSAKLTNLVSNSLKGNDVTNSNYDNYTASDESEEEQVEIETNSKVESLLINILYNNESLREKILPVLNVDEFSDSLCKDLYDKYVDGIKMDDIEAITNGLSESEKDTVNKMLSKSENIKHDNSDIIETLNQLIRKIKVFNIEKSKSNSLDDIFTINLKIKEINKTEYIK